MSQKYNGSVKWYNQKKFFGFIVDDKGGSDIFMHGTGLPEGYAPQEGEKVTYELDEDRQGRRVAVNVRAA